MTDYLVDNSAWARLASGDAHVTARLRAIERSPADVFVTCGPQALEFCHSARTPEEHAQLRALISLGFPLERAPSEALLLDLQAALWNAGLVRAAGPLDLVLAGYAIENGATILSCDRDFEHLARVSELQHEFVEPAE